MGKKKQRAKLPDLEPSVLADPTPHMLIQNIVATFNLGVDHIDLKKVSLRCDFLDYNPIKFAAATLRICNPRTTALLFSSGNVVCTGGKTKAETRLAARKYVRLLQRFGLRISMRNFHIQNIVATSYVDAAIRLRDIASDYGAYCSYEPELFPGLVFRTIAPKVVFLVFRSGKVVITGTKTSTCAYDVFKKFYHAILKEYVDDEDDDISSAHYRQKYKNDLHTPGFFTRT